MKKLYLVLTLVLFAITANAQQAQLTGGVSQNQSYSALGFTLNDSHTSAIQLVFAHNQGQVPSHTGIGFSYVPVVWDKLNLLSGFDVNAVVRDDLEFGTFLNLNVGVRVYKFDLLYSIPAFQGLNRDYSVLSSSGLSEPNVKLRFRF